nr:unnamed protein product [Spirometra erinaceieuropaei]
MIPESSPSYGTGLLDLINQSVGVARTASLKLKLISRSQGFGCHASCCLPDLVSVVVTVFISKVFPICSQPMAQNNESLKSEPKSENAHLSCVNCLETPISSFDILNSYRPPGRNPSAVSAAAALILQAAVDSQNQRKQRSLSNVSPLSNPILKVQCPSPPDDNAAAAAAAAAVSMISRPMSHSPNTNSKITAALALAMAASSPPSTCPSSSSSGQLAEQCSAEFRSENPSQSIGMLFRSPVGGYESVDGGGNGEFNFPPTSLNSGNIPSFASLNSSTVPPELSASACLANAMLLPASLVTALGQTMHAGPYHQTSSPAYLPTIGNVSSSFSLTSNSDPATTFSVAMSAASPTNLDAGRFSSASRTSSVTLHEDGSRKREQRLLKNREAARECRRKKKEYVRFLERRVTILESQNQQLIDELQNMKALCAAAAAAGDGQLRLSGTGSAATACRTSPTAGIDRRQADGVDYVDAASPRPTHPSTATGVPADCKLPSRIPAQDCESDHLSSPDRQQFGNRTTANLFSTGGCAPDTKLPSIGGGSRGQLVADLAFLKSASERPPGSSVAAAAASHGALLLQSVASSALSSLKTRYSAPTSDDNFVRQSGRLPAKKMALADQDASPPLSQGSCVRVPETLGENHYGASDWYACEAGKNYSSVEQQRSVDPLSPRIPPLKRALRKLDIERHRLSLPADSLPHTTETVEKHEQIASAEQ